MLYTYVLESICGICTIFMWIWMLVFWIFVIFREMNLRQLATLELKENSGLTSMQKTGMNVIKHIFCYGKYFLKPRFS